MDHSFFGWMLLRLALTAPIALMIWLIRRDIRRDERENGAVAAAKQAREAPGERPSA